MVTATQLKSLVSHESHLNPAGRQAALKAELDAMDSTAEEIVTAAVEGLRSDDRNTRVAMLRVLGLFPGQAAATAAIVDAMSDAKRRVREAAMKAAAGHHDYAGYDPVYVGHLGDPSVIEALHRRVEDENETVRLRGIAFYVLSSGSARKARPAEAADALRALSTSERYRPSVLVRLCATPELTPEARGLLEEFVVSGSKQEAVMATRALCDFVLAPLDLLPNGAIRDRLLASATRAEDVRDAIFGGTGNHWVPRELVVSMLREHGATQLRRLPAD